MVFLAQVGAPARGDFPLEAAQGAGLELAFVKQGRVLVQRLLGFHHRRQFLVLHADELQRLVGGEFVLGDDRGHGLARVAHLVNGDKRVVLDGVAEIGVQTLQVVAPHHVVDAGMGFSLGRVHGDDPGVGVGAPQHLGIGHAREPHVAHVERPPRHLGAAVAARHRVVHHLELAALVFAHPRASFITAAALRMAFTMETYPVQRQRLPSMW